MTKLTRLAILTACLGFMAQAAHAQVEVSTDLFYGSPYVWRGEVVHALRSLRDPPPVTRVSAYLPGTRTRHGAMHDSLREAAGRVAMMEFALRLEHLLVVASGEAEPFLNVLPDELGAWDDLADLLQAKAQTIGYEELTAEPYLEALRDVVRVYRGGGETLRLGDAPADQPERA